MYVALTTYRKIREDSIMILPDGILIEAIATNNTGQIVPDGNFNSVIFSNFVEARKLMTDLREQTAGRLPLNFHISEDGNTHYIANCWETLEQYGAYRDTLISNGLQEIFEDARAELATLLGLEVKSYPAEELLKSPGEMTLEDFVALTL